MSYEVWGDGDDQSADPDWQDQATEAGWLNPEMEAKAIMDVFRERHRQQHGQAEHKDDQRQGTKQGIETFHFSVSLKFAITFMA